MSFMVMMLRDEWWVVPGFTQTLSFSISVWAKLRFAFSRPYVFCLMISVSLMYHYAALMCIFSQVACFHLAQISEKFPWLLSFQEDVLLRKAAVCSSARTVHGSLLWPKLIFGSSLEVSQCGQNTSFSKMLGVLFSFYLVIMESHLIPVVKILYLYLTPQLLPKLYIKSPGLLA